MWYSTPIEINHLIQKYDINTFKFFEKKKKYPNLYHKMILSLSKRCSNWRKWNSFWNADLNKLPISSLIPLSNNSIKKSTSTCIISNHNCFNHFKPKKKKKKKSTNIYKKKNTYLRAKPIFTRESENRENSNSQLAAQLYNGSQGPNTGLVTRPDRQAPDPGPPPVPIHDQSHMSRHWLCPETRR